MHLRLKNKPLGRETKNGNWGVAGTKRQRALEKVKVKRGDEVEVGDRVGIWICGDRAGLYAMGTVTSEPVVKADSETGIGYWINPQEGRRPRARVRDRYDRVFLDRPLLKQYIEADPSLQHLRILHFPRGTNFPISVDDWEALASWVEDP